VKSKTSFFIVLLTIALFQIIYAISFAEPITFTLIHVNDTHSHLDPEAKILPIDGNPTQVQLGGLTFLKTALDRISAADNKMLFQPLHF